jgi:putative nucleotidyltransferase with HDIG domain
MDPAVAATERQGVRCTQFFDMEAHQMDSRALSDSMGIRSVLADLLRISLSETSLENQLGLILERICSVPELALEAKGAIFLVEGDQKVLTLKAHRNLAGPLLTRCATVPFGHCLCGRAAASATMEYAQCLDYRHEVRFEGMNPHGHYVIPIISRGSVVGVLNLYLADGHVRDPKEEEFLRTVTDLLSGILVHRQTQQHLEAALSRVRQTLGTVVQAMGTTLETRDPYTAGHQRRVADLARAIATEMGLSADQIDAVRTAATIHDIGKISVPAELLCKPTRLSATEFELIKLHSKVGYDILKGIDFVWPIAQIVLQHHERLDGSGYPAGLRGEHILLESRIIAVADVVEAMSTHRPYRAAVGLDGALAEITKNKGVTFDASAVEACVKLFTQKGFKL